MRTLDRYVIRSFLFTSAMFFIGLMAIRIVLDLAINADEFAKNSDSGWKILEDIVSFYGYQSLLYFTELGGVIVVFSAAFTLAMMNHTNELTAMLASGVSLRRVTAPIIVFSLVLCGLITLDAEFVIPRVADKLVRDQGDVPGARDINIRLPMDGGSAVWHSSSYRPEERRMGGAVVVLRNARRELVGRVTEGEAYPACVDGRDGWLMRQATFTPNWKRPPANTAAVPATVTPHTIIEQARAAYRAKHGQDVPPADVKSITGISISEPIEGYKLRVVAEEFAADVPQDGRVAGGWLKKATFTYSTREDQQLATFIADAARWVVDNPLEGHWQLHNGRLFVESDLTAEDLMLRQSSRWVDYMSSEQLARLLETNRLPDRSAAVMAKQVRITEPLNGLVMLLLGLPFILSRERNIKASAGLCLLTVATFYVFVYICRYMGLPPTLGAWLPALIFGPIAVAMFDSVKT